MKETDKAISWLIQLLILTIIILFVCFGSNIDWPATLKKVGVEMKR